MILFHTWRIQRYKHVLILPAIFWCILGYHHMAEKYGDMKETFPVANLATTNSFFVGTYVRNNGREDELR